MLFARVLAIALALSPGLLLAQGVALPEKSSLTPEQIEQFLLTAKIIRTREIGKGTTGSEIATLSDGTLTHDAHVQNVNVEMPIFTSNRRTEINFKDEYRYNIAAYRLSRLLGLTNIPVSVERRVEGANSAVTWWIDDVLMDELGRLKAEKAKTLPAGWQAEKAAGYIHLMRAFDELIANTDRNVGNQIWTRDGRLWLIDHTRAFRLQHKLANPQILLRCDGGFLKGLRDLTVESVTAAAGRSLTKDEITAVIARRDLLVQHFDGLIEARTEAAVVYSLMR